jgi:hypothetical protein
MISRSSGFRSRQAFNFLGKEEEYRVKMQIRKKVEAYYGNLPHRKTDKQKLEENIWQPWEQWPK